MEELKNSLGKILIAGPCALESRMQLRECVQALKEDGVTIIRASLWKPRTQPGWEGIGDEGIDILLEETIPHGMIPATEVIYAEHAEKIIKAMKKYGPDVTAVLWIGARNQNHLEQQRIARVIANSGMNIYLMAKNQAWYDERHWAGICEHLLSAGMAKEKVMLCHRGFCPGLLPNPREYRNLPDMLMAMRVQAKMGVPMILDPSHIGGTRENVIDIMLEGELYPFDGMIVEVHCNPDQALTDAKQQLRPDQLRRHMDRLEAVQ
jgi:chorismate mutase